MVVVARKYSGASAVVAGALGLSTNEARPVRFHGKVVESIYPLRLALQTLGELVWSDSKWMDEQSYSEWIERVLDPVMAKTGKAKKLFVCLDDALHLVPLDALPRAAGKGIVGEDKQLVILPSFRALVATPKRSRAPASLFSMGGVSLSSSRGSTLVSSTIVSSAFDSIRSDTNQ